MRLLLSILLLLSAAASFAAPPNVVFILADDLGWGDLGCHGHPFIRTPNLDRLARQGADFHQFNVAHPVCSPSRAAFMTGMFPARFSIRQAIGALSKNIESHTADWLDPKAVTLPRLLRDAGYTTAHFGKWHLCSGQAKDAPLPEAYGIGEATLFEGTSPREGVRHTAYANVFDDAVAFIKRSKDRPFYLNVWLHETHLAHYPSAASLQELAHLDERQRIYAAVALDADRGAGKILDTLRDLGLEQNTLVIFASDNGPENTHPTQKQMRDGYGGYYSVGEPSGKGRKRSLHEGGVRVPLLVRWPGRVPAGHVDKTTVLSATDLLPTVCAAVGVKLPADFHGDGENVLAAWEGHPQPRSKPLFWDWNGIDRPATNWPRWAVRDGEWKLLMDDAGRVELYRASDDRLEEKNLASANADIVARLKAKLDAWKATLPQEPAAGVVSKGRNTRAVQP